MRVSVQVGPARLPVLEVRLPGSTVLGDLRCEVARRFRIPVDSLELVRVVSGLLFFLLLLRCIAPLLLSYVCVLLDGARDRGRGMHGKYALPRGWIY